MFPLHSLKTRLVYPGGRRGGPALAASLLARGVARRGGRELPSTPLPLYPPHTLEQTSQTEARLNSPQPRG